MLLEAMEALLKSVNELRSGSLYLCLGCDANQSQMLKHQKFPFDTQLGSSGRNSHASARGAGPPAPPSTSQPRSRAARLPDSAAGCAAHPPAPSYSPYVACHSQAQTEVAPASDRRRSSETNGC